jgi:hypothetical protein
MNDAQILAAALAATLILYLLLTELLGIPPL